MPTPWQSSTRPVAMHIDTTNAGGSVWVGYTPPSWVRVIEIQNRDGTNAIRLANPGTAEGPFGAEAYLEIGPGESRLIPWSAGQSRSQHNNGAPWDVVVGSAVAAAVPFTLIARLSKEL